MKTQQIQLKSFGLKEICEDLNIRYIENEADQIRDRNPGALKKI